MPRSLRGRLLGAFLLLALAILLTVGSALFVVLRSLHADETESGLRGIAASVLPQVRESIANGDFRGTVLEIRNRLASGDPPIETYIVGVAGQLRDLDGSSPPGMIVIPADTAPNATVSGATTIDGERYLYAATVLRPRALAGKAVAFVTLDRSGAQAFADVVRRLPAVLLIGGFVGAVLAWLLATSVTKPLARVASAAVGLPSGTVEPLALEGPDEIRRLIGTFNAMADELAALRQRESELLADLRHDLRTPLTVIGGFAAALADGTATGDDATRAARAIEEEAARLERLVGELGALERLREGSAGLRPEQLDADALLTSTRDRFAAAAAAVNVSLEASGGTGTEGLGFAADRLAVERILGNLVANALAAAPADGHVWLAAQSVSAEGDGRPAIALSVTDDGPGFPPGAGARVFERFYRADPARSGTGAGLGLAIVRELAEAHGGAAHAENVAPHGARVSVVLPVVPRI
jgi:signal transduction histidine kinase